ncbi:MAG TPA: hypothetical protein VD998_01055, partial [Verrucomicrobiae bacterium]|nr:hypothetical protein [Verrucomicrobiae bacterium]
DGVIEINVNDPEFTNFLRTALKDQSLHDGVLDINPEGVRQETPIAPQEVTPEKSNLDKARDEFYKLQTELEQAQGKWGGFKAESRKRKESEIAELKTKFEAAEKNYKELRAEQVADDAEKALEESHKAADVMLEQYMNRSKTKTERGMELVDQKLKWIKSVPTKYKVAASFALLGVGLTGGVILAGTAFGARKIMSSASASAGTYGLLNSFKDYTQRKRIERDLKSQYPDNLEGHIAGMRIRARLDGKSTEDLKKDELYIQLVDKYRESFVANYEKDYGNRSQEVKARRLQEMLDQNNEALQKAKVTEKLWKRFNQVGSIVIGTAIGSGKVFELLNAKKEAKDAVASTGITSNVSGYFSESKPDLPPSPEMDVPETYKPTLSAAEAQKLLDEPVLEPEKTEILHNGNSTGASIESYRDSALVHVGNRGIEGSLIDLKSTQPERYAKMVSWLENRYPKLSGNEPGLIHRFVTEQAPDGKNLDRIMSAEVLIDKEGAITLDIDKVQFMRSPEINLGHGEGIRFNVTHAEAPLERVVIPDEPEIKPIHDVEWPKPHEFEEGEVTVKSMPATVEQAREIAAGSVEKTSDALQLVLSEKYKTFVERELHVSAKSLNKIKHLTYKEFLTSMNVSERFNKSFAGLAKFLADKEIKPNAKMHTALIELAKQWKYKN